MARTWRIRSSTYPIWPRPEPRQWVLKPDVLSYDAHEVINTVALAIRHGITATQLRDETYTHPSMTEAFNQLLGTLA
jgi:thiamine monophosphate synthase